MNNIKKIYQAILAEQKDFSLSKEELNNAVCDLTELVHIFYNVALEKSPHLLEEEKEDEN